jgi:hypothetical protein
MLNGTHSPLVNSLQNLSSYNVRQEMEDRFTALKDEVLVYNSIEEDAEIVNEMLNAFQTGKFAGENVNIKDILMTKDYPKLFYAATEILIKSRLMPNRIISDNLFVTIPYTGNAINVTVRTMGGVEVEEIGEGEEYPETSSAVSDQAYRINLWIKKYGAKVPATRELIESDNWGIWAYTISQLTDALLNKKEKIASTILNEFAGYTLIDNANATNVPLGSTTGRGIDGAQNGALGMDDIMRILSWMHMRGYNIDTILINPFSWAMWARDPEIREGILGDGVIHIPQGNAASGWDMPWGGLGQPFNRFGSSTATLPPGGAGDPNTPDPIYGKLGIAPYAFPNLTPFGATFMTQPKYMDRPVKVLVTPMVPYYKISSGGKAGKYATNIIFAESSRCGLILQKENPTMEQWSDIEREIDYTKIREGYGMALQEQGRAVCVARNIVVDRTYTFDNVNSQTLASLTYESDLI